MTFAEKVKKLRKERNMSQAELAKALGVSTRSVQSYEQGDSYPRRREMYDRLASALGCDRNYLLTEESSFITSAGEKYGRRGAMQARALAGQLASALASGGDIADEDLDEMMKAIQDAYWIAKEKNRRFAPDKQS